MSPTFSVLFVCLGNICRSPAAEAIFSHLVHSHHLEDQFFIDSAGTAGYHIGSLPDQRMRDHGIKRGYSLDTRCRQFKAEDFKQFDLIVTMDDQNYRNVLALAPNETAKSRLKKMSDYLVEHNYNMIPDPYHGDADGFELVLDLLEEASTHLLREILEEKDLANNNL